MNNNNFITIFRSRERQQPGGTKLKPHFRDLQTDIKTLPKTSWPPERSREISASPRFYFFSFTSQPDSLWGERRLLPPLFYPEHSPPPTAEPPTHLPFNTVSSRRLFMVAAQAIHTIPGGGSPLYSAHLLEVPCKGRLLALRGLWLR